MQVIRRKLIYLKPKEKTILGNEIKKKWKNITLGENS